MASPALSKSLSTNTIQSKPKDESLIEKYVGEKIQGRRRYYSSGDARALPKPSETNVYDLRRDWSNGSDVKADPPSEVKTQKYTPIGSIVLESIMRKYEVEKSDFDALVDMRLPADELVEVEELCNLALFEWNLEETLFEEDQEKTNSLKQYFALLEECLQTRPYRARSNSTGSYDLTSKKEMNFSTKRDKDIKGEATQSNKTGRQGNLETELKQSSNSYDVCVTENLQVGIKNDRQYDEDPKLQEITNEMQKTSEQLNSADLSLPEDIQSNKPNRESCDSSMVSMTTAVWSQDHTYCLTCSPTKPAENLQKSNAIVTAESRDGAVQLKPDATGIPNKDKVGQVETSDSKDTDTARDVPNKEVPESDAITGNMEARDMNDTRDIPYKVIPTKSDGAEAELLDDRPDGDKPRDIPYKDVGKKNDSGTTGSEEPESKDSKISRDTSSIKSRPDTDKPRDTNKNAREKDNRVNSEESKTDVNEAPETPKKKIRKAADNSEDAGKTRSRDSTQRRDSSQSRDSIQPRDSAEPRNSIPSPPPTKSDQSNTPSPLRRSKRTRQPTPRRLDTYYY